MNKMREYGLVDFFVTTMYVLVEDCIYRLQHYEHNRDRAVRMAGQNEELKKPASITPRDTRAQVEQAFSQSKISGGDKGISLWTESEF